MEKSNRIRATRSNASLTASVKAPKKKGMPSWLLSLIIVAVTVAVIFTVVASALSTSGLILRARTAASTENFKVTGSMMKYFYHSTYESFDSNYESYMSYLSLDNTKSLKDQVYGDPAKGKYETSYLGEFDGTWYDFIMSMATESVKQMLVFCEEANARGLTLTDSDYAQITIQLSTLEVTANAVGYTLDQYINMMYGSGVKAKDVEKCLELSALASIGATAVQEEILNGITDTHISDKYNASKDDFDVVDYVYFAMSIKYDDIAKEILGSDYTTAELNAKKDEVDAKYNEEVEDIKTVMAALEQITDKDEFIKYMLNHNADSYYDTAYGKITLDDDKLPEEAALEAIKKATIEKAVAEAFEGKTEVVDDVVVDGETYTLYEQSVTKEFAEAMKTLKKSVFEGLVSDLDTYKVTKSPYSSTNDVSKWAFEAGRKEGDIKTITNNDKPEESYSSAVYMLTKTRYADQTKTKNIAYMLFSKKDDAQKAIDALKNATLTKDSFLAKGSELSSTTTSIIEEYIEGSLGIQAFDDWAYSDTIKVGDLTTAPIEIEANTTYLVGYYYEEGEETWKVNVKSELFSENYNTAYEALVEKYAVDTKEGTINNVSDGYLPAGLKHSHSSSGTLNS